MVKKVKINPWNRDRLKNLNDYSVDENLNTLMKIVENDMPFVKYPDEMTSINLHEETVEKLDSFKICNGESRDAIITRMLLCYDEINNFAEEYWIPFKLTSTLNKLLSIKGMLEINTSQIVFDEGNGVFDNNLPMPYIVDGNDLSKEFQNWINMINWREIEEIVSKNDVELYTYKNKLYYLEVNYL